MSGNKVIVGLALIFIGLFFLLTSLDVIDMTFGDLVSFALPVFIIVLGVWFIVRKGRTVQTPPTGESCQAPPPPPPSGSGSHSRPYQYQYSYEFGGKSTAAPDSSAGGRVKYAKFIGDMFIDCRNIDLHNVEVSTFLGDNEIKLHGGRLGPGLNRLVVSGFIGDVRILVPPDMPVLCTSSSFIGDVELLGKRSSGLGNTIDCCSETYESAESKLYIAVNHFIGDVRVHVV